MNLTEFEKNLSDFSTGYETYIKLMSDIKRLDNLIQANEKQLNDSLIKIPFTHLYFVDGLGIFKHQTPTLIKQNRQLITKYNKKLKEAQQLEGQIINHLKAVIDDYSHSTGKNRETKKRVIDSYFSNYSINKKLDEYDRLER